MVGRSAQECTPTILTAFIHLHPVDTGTSVNSANSANGSLNGSIVPGDAICSVANGPNGTLNISNDDGRARSTSFASTMFGVVSECRGVVVCDVVCGVVWCGAVRYGVAQCGVWCGVRRKFVCVVVSPTPPNLPSHLDHHFHHAIMPSPLHTSHCHNLTTSHRHTVTPSHHHTITPSHPHTITPSHHHTLPPSPQVPEGVTHPDNLYEKYTRPRDVCTQHCNAHTAPHHTTPHHTTPTPHFAALRRAA